MKSRKITLMSLAKKQLDHVLKQIMYSVGFLFEHSVLEKQLYSALLKEQGKIEMLENNIDIAYFGKFLKTPQIHDLLTQYLFYLLKNNLLILTPKKKILKNNVMNYIIGVLENNYSDLSSESTIISIKEYVNILTKVCSANLGDAIYSDIVEKKTGKIVVRSFMTDILTQIEAQSKEIDYIELILSKEFVPYNSLYDKIKTEYIKVLKQYYQSGFIYLLGEYKFNEFYIPPILMVQRDQMYRGRILRTDDQIDVLRNRWTNIFNDRNIVYIVGGAGYGKSLFLRNIINNFSKIRIDNIQDYILIYCDLKAYYNNNDYGKKTLVDFFQESMISVSGMEDISKEFIRYYLDIGRCIILLDALDEVPKNLRDELHKKVVAFFATHNQNNKVCITSRNRGFLPKQNIEVLEIFPLNSKDIEDYIEKMISLKKFKREDKNTFMEQASVLIEKDFLNNFLVLSLLVNIYKAEKELPENKIDLYKKCFEYIAKKREEEKSKTGYNWKNIYPLMKDSTFINLSILAAPNNRDVERKQIETLLLNQYKNKYRDEAEAECAIKEFLEFCSNRTELFVPAAVDDKFKFFHRSFFEYFYARYIHQQSEIADMYDLMAKFDIDSEIFELTVALVKEDNEEKYQKLIDYIFDKANEELSSSEQKTTAFGILTLAMQVIDDAYYIRKYYEIVIQYNDLMSGNKIREMNQKFMCMWLEKEIESDAKKMDEFVNAFSKHCVRYVLKAIVEGGIPRFQDLSADHLLNIGYDKKFSYNMMRNMGNVPFYMILCYNHNCLYDLVEKYIDTESTYINLFGLKAKEKKGVKYYKKLSQTERIQFLELLCGIN